MTYQHSSVVFFYHPAIDDFETGTKNVAHDLNIGTDYKEETDEVLLFEYEILKIGEHAWRFFCTPYGEQSKLKNKLFPIHYDIYLSRITPLFDEKIEDLRVDVQIICRIQHPLFGFAQIGKVNIPLNRSEKWISNIINQSIEKLVGEMLSPAGPEWITGFMKKHEASLKEREIIPDVIGRLPTYADQYQEEEYGVCLLDFSEVKYEAISKILLLDSYSFSSVKIYKKRQNDERESVGIAIRFRDDVSPRELARSIVELSPDRYQNIYNGYHLFYFNSFERILNYEE